MSLTDLKKSNSGNGKKKKFTIDEFINDAENYAKGAPKIVSAKASAPKNKKQKKVASKKLFKHATFTFNDKTFEELNELAASSKLAKSHILRILIAQLYGLDKEAQLAILLKSEVE